MLYINSCAERLFDSGDEYYLEEIARRLLNSIQQDEIVLPGNARFMQFRIRVIYREDIDAKKMGQIKNELFFQSQAYAIVNAGAN